MSKTLLIDYENVQGIDLCKIVEIDCKVSIFTGTSQSKIPFELVTSAQVLGNRLEWVKIDGNGPNALDFHIAYYLGRYIVQDPRNEYYILSKDKGFDPLVKHLVKGRLSCKRITSINELLPTRRAKNVDVDLGRIVSNLRKIEKSRRPRNESALKQHLKSIMGKSGTEEKVGQIMDLLRNVKAIGIENGRVNYKVDNITSR